MRALLSVYDKTGVVEFGRGLAELGYELVSTGGTLTVLAVAGVPVTAVADVTGFPEILDGRVKSLHPRIHGGLLARHDDPSHVAALTDHEIAPISVVAANLYPFAATVARPGVTLDEALEQIDIGGPAMIRAAAKNFPHVLVLTDPSDYAAALEALSGETATHGWRQRMAAKAYAHTAAYDAVVAENAARRRAWASEVVELGGAPWGRERPNHGPPPRGLRGASDVRAPGLKGSKAGKARRPASRLTGLGEPQYAAPLGNRWLPRPHKSSVKS